MRLFVTGGAGHTGCNFLSLFLSDSDSNVAIALVRKDTDLSYLPDSFADRLQTIEGDIKSGSISRLMEGCDAVMHIAHQTLCPYIIEAASAAKVDRVFFVTTTGVFSKFNDLSKGYLEVEEFIRNSNLDWTILRPTMIFGSERDVNLHKLLRYLDTHAVFPIFGDGNGLMQPVYVGDLAAGLFLALKSADKTVRKEYNLSGRSPFTYNELVETAIKELGAKAKIVHIPHVLSLYLAMASELILRSRSPIKSEQVRRLSEDKAYSWSSAHKDFGYNPGNFAERVAQEVTHLRRLSILS